MEAEEIDMSGKVDTPRPYSVDSQTFSSNWERTFGQSNHEPAQVPVMPCDEPEELNHLEDYKD